MSVALLVALMRRRPLEETVHVGSLSEAVGEQTTALETRKVDLDSMVWFWRAAPFWPGLNELQLKLRGTVDEFVEICAETLGVRASKARIGVEVRKCMVSWRLPVDMLRPLYIKKSLVT
jgi:hypothetical protein